MLRNATPRPQALSSLLAAALVAMLFAAAPAQAQDVPPVSQQNAAAQPLADVALQAMPVQDNDALRRQHDPTAPGPFRFAEAVDVSLTAQNSGTWETLPDGSRLWRLRLRSKEAQSLNLGFTRYRMPEGGRLFIYAPGYGEHYGPFTAADNEDHGELWTPLIKGEEIVIEVALPASVREGELDLRLARVNHAFRAFDGSDVRTPKSGACNVDVACPEADPWSAQVRSVGAYTIGGTDTCSGALVNNTSGDRTPYFLTAAHCGISESNDQTMVTYWNYQNSTCRTPGSAASGSPGDGTRDQFNSGSILRAEYGGGGFGISQSDMTLVEMEDAIDPAYNVFYAGWDRTDAAPAEATAIHHPGVEEKRISFENDPTSITGYLEPSGGNTHIRVADWDLGTTEGGSSGSPLFNPDMRIVGKLSGGYAACGNNTADWYGRVFNDWEGGGTPDTRLRDWLDPENTGATTLDGVGQEDDDVPPAVSQLTVTDVGGTTVSLAWEAPGDDGVEGTATAYDVRYSTEPIETAEDFENATEASGEPTPSEAGTTETFTVEGLSFETTYYFAFRTRDNNGNASDRSDTVSATTLGAPTAGLSVDSLGVELTFGESTTETLTLTNTGESELLYEIEASTDPGITLNAVTGTAPQASIPTGTFGKNGDDPRNGRPPAKDDGGPDGFGYRWIDSDAPNGPTYSFVDISEDGSLVSLGDDDSQTVTLSFEFPFYDEDQNEVTIGSNGYLTFGGDGTDYTNDGIPNANEPNALIAPFWEDLNPSRGGDIYYFDDTANDRFIVQYSDVTPYDSGDTGTYTFQVLLYASGAVVYQYQDMSGLTNNATVGIENADGTDGLEIAANATYVEDGLAVQILPPSINPDWLTVTPSQGAVPSGETLDLEVLFDAGAVDEDRDSTYTATLTLMSNAPGASSRQIPVAMVVDGEIPVELVGFEAVPAEDGGVLLRWSTASELNNSGFEVQYHAGSPDASGGAVFEELAFVEGAGTTSEPRTYTHPVRDLEPGRYTFRLRQVDYDGGEEFSGVETATVTLGSAYRLEAPYPNPFRNEAVVRFAVRQEQPTEVSLYNALGQKVRTLYDDLAEANRMHEIRITSGDLSSGVYVVRVQGESFSATQTVVLVK